ncbi:MAG: alpha/beta hydrolase [Pseudomonadales bacterium]
MPPEVMDTGEELDREFRRADLTALRRIFNRLADVANIGLPAIGALHTAVSLHPWSPATADILVPTGEGPYPVLVYLHGGAWVAGNPASHRKLTARFAAAGYLVISIDYRLAPEHPFPAGLEDCVAAVRWAASHARRFGGDPTRLVIGGDSAGANLAAATALSLRRAIGAPRIHALMLIYGVFDMSDLGSTAVSRFLHQAYLPGELVGLLEDARVSPIHAAHRLPPCFVVIGTRDTLLAQNRTLRDRLVAAGKPHVYIEEPGMPHGFMQMEFLGGVRAIVEQATRYLNSHLPTDHESRLLRRLLRSWYHLASRLHGAPARKFG